MTTPATTDLDHFYSAEPAEAWQAIIGDDLHYHFGYFRGREDLATGLRQTVRRFYDAIPEGARVLDVGCGWGGPARLLAAERGCTVRGITVSAAQAEYCWLHGLEVQHADVEHAALDGQYDVAFALESFEHLRDRANVLRRLRACADSLVLSCTCAAVGVTGPRLTFGGSIALCSLAEMRQALAGAGWEVRVLRHRRLESIPTLLHWKHNLDRAYGAAAPPGQLGVLRGLVEGALSSLGLWCQAFPLVDIIAR